jgi:hypothetical protein
MTQAKKKTTKEDKKEVAKASTGTAVVSSDFANDLAADAGLGMENMTADDLSIPRIGIIQSLSPQRSKTKPEYIEGAKEGDIFNNVSKTLMDGEKGIKVVPIKFTKSYLEWIPRKAGGGLAAIHPDASCLENCSNDKGQMITPEGNIINPTAEYFVFVIDENGRTTPAVISMASTSLKQAKNWNTLMNQLEVIVNDKPITPPTFYGVYNMKAVPQSNDSGEWFRWEIAADGTVEDIDNGRDIYAKAKDFLASIKEGAVKVAEPLEDSASATENDDDPM